MKKTKKVIKGGQSPLRPGHLIGGPPIPAGRRKKTRSMGSK